jgi:hypothetical protein
MLIPVALTFDAVAGEDSKELFTTVANALTVKYQPVQFVVPDDNMLSKTPEVCPTNANVRLNGAACILLTPITRFDVPLKVNARDPEIIVQAASAVILVRVP